nr:exocyst complex component SEC8 [Ipomoea batatas]
MAEPASPPLHLRPPPTAEPAPPPLHLRPPPTAEPAPPPLRLRPPLAAEPTSPKTILLSVSKVLTLSPLPIFYLCISQRVRPTIHEIITTKIKSHAQNINSSRDGISPTSHKGIADDRSEYIVQERKNHSDGDSQKIASTTHEKEKLYANTSEALDNSVEEARRLPSIKLRDNGEGSSESDGETGKARFCLLTDLLSGQVNIEKEMI